MASHQAIKNMFAVIFFKTPSRRFKSEEEAKVVTGIWTKLMDPINDEAISKALERFMKIPKIWPDDDPIALIYEMAKPKIQETFGDFLEIVESLPGDFGRNREDEAMKWLSSRSPLSAAVLNRFGYQNLCNSDPEKNNFTRGTLQKIFDQEKSRAEENGGTVIISALEKSNQNTLSFARKRGNFESLEHDEGKLSKL